MWKVFNFARPMALFMDANDGKRRRVYIIILRICPPESHAVYAGRAGWRADGWRSID